MKSIFLLPLVFVSASLFSLDRQPLFRKETTFSFQVTTLLGPKTIRSVLFPECSDTKTLRGEMVYQGNFEKVTVRFLMEFLKARYSIVGEMDIMARKSVKMDDDIVYYYSSPLEKHKLLSAIIKEYKTNELYAIPQKNTLF